MSLCVFSSSDGVEVSLEASKVARVLDYPGMHDGCISVPFPGIFLQTFITMVDHAFQIGRWPAVRGTEAMVEDPAPLPFWDVYFQMVDFFRVKVPFLDHAYAEYLTYRKNVSCTASVNERAVAEMAGHWHSQRKLDRIVDIGVRASNDPTSFPETWDAFRTVVYWAASSKGHAPFDCFTWMELVMHPRWQHIRSQELVRLATLAMTAAYDGDQCRLKPVRGKVYSASIVAEPDEDREDRRHVSLGPEFVLRLVAIPRGVEEHRLVSVEVKRASGSPRPVLIEGIVTCDVERGDGQHHSHTEHVYAVQENGKALTLLNLEPYFGNFRITLSVNLKFQNLM